MVYAIIGGSGLQRLSIMKPIIESPQMTPYGVTSAPVMRGTIGNCSAVFLQRHGPSHSIPPHLINFRANMWALKELGANAVISVATVGGIKESLNPGMLVIPSQIIDYTWGRACSYFDAGDTVTHVDFTNPFSETVRVAIMAAAQLRNVEVVNGGVYAATHGPRLETAAEINRIDRDGGEIVGMTGMPEAVLARELGLAYAMIAVVVNAAAGRGASSAGIRIQEAAVVASAAMAKVESILEALVSS